VPASTDRFGFASKGGGAARSRKRSVQNFGFVYLREDVRPFLPGVLAFLPFGQLGQCWSTAAVYPVPALVHAPRVARNS